MGTATPGPGGPLPVPTACFVAQVHTGIEETSHRKQLLDVEEVGVLQGLTEDLVADIWDGGRGCRVCGPPAPNPGGEQHGGGEGQ